MVESGFELRRVGPQGPSFWHSSTPPDCPWIGTPFAELSSAVGDASSPQPPFPWEHWDCPLGKTAGCTVPEKENNYYGMSIYWDPDIWSHRGHGLREKSIRY